MPTTTPGPRTPKSDPTTSSTGFELRGNVAAARARAARNAAGLSMLLADRPELGAVDSPAIWAHDSVRWSA